MAQTQKESRAAEHEYGKDESDSRETRLWPENLIGQKSRDRALLTFMAGAQRDRLAEYKRLSNIISKKNFTFAAPRPIPRSWHGKDYAERLPLAERKRFRARA